MHNEIEMIDTEDIFDEMARCGKVPVQKSKDRRKRSGKELFAEIKVKMVMRIYSVPHARALEIIAAREAACRAAEKAETSSANDELMDAGTFLGS